ncbi:hypothetical protein [Desulforamulus ruminis]|uniref:Uncharacterized protein n=1 Tax=Desulforamulus ruminis (strain ATCC 23193 / DSM 2154 / NCIMB 8452 / DL) TaxID=696281 RepID=F6DKT8_DESRL|nr:hypothetical protein [Desulforamulus ruminis]AEG61570.1 hypothetical protein Desru_3365 [Desulforamulus ruminis DSM 2154]
MVQINLNGLEVAPLSDEQLDLLNNAQGKLNQLAKMNQQIYLLAVTKEE